MEYLKELFHEFLNSEGEVYIAGYPFDRDRILRSFEEVGYKEAFEQWLQDRKGEMLNKANEILALYNNADFFHSLQDTYRRGAVIPFVGAGLSMPSGYPGWTQFLYKILQETRVLKSDLDNLIVNGQYEEAAQSLFEGMPSNTFLAAVINNFGRQRKLYGPVQQLPLLFRQSVITTNFDDVLERCYNYADITFNEVLFGTEIIELRRRIGAGKHVLVKLHGKADSSQHRVLTKREYDGHYNDNNIIDQAIESLCHKTLLFLGCSLTVDRTIKALATFVEQRGSVYVPFHYAFLCLRENEDRLARRDQLAQSNIFPIWYPNEWDHDECIEALLTKLQEGAE